MNPSEPQESPESLRERTDVRIALEETAAAKPPRPVPTQRKIVVSTHGFVLLGAIALYYSFRSGLWPISDHLESLLQRLSLGAAWIVLVLLITQCIDTYLLSRMSDAVARFNLRRLVRLFAAVGLFFIALSVIFANWYGAAVSLGLLSLILGFALQTPITSFIGWIYILVRHPYRVGDRIRIGSETGDVIDVSYLDTTLWEFGGEYLSTDHPSGRVIKFPNSAVLNSAVYNYSWPLFPYVWNEISFHVAYESDLPYIEWIMQESAEAEIGAAMLAQVGVYRQLLAETPVDHLEVREHPSVFFRVSNNTWIEATVRYLVHPKEAGRVKSRLIRVMLDRLNTEPELVLFPKSNLR